MNTSWLSTARLLPKLGIGKCTAAGADRPHSAVGRSAAGEARGPGLREREVGVDRGRRDGGRGGPAPRPSPARRRRQRFHDRGTIERDESDDHARGVQLHTERLHMGLDGGVTQAPREYAYVRREEHERGGGKVEDQQRGPRAPGRSLPGLDGLNAVRSSGRHGLPPIHGVC